MILIDGYDVPVSRNFGNPEVEEIQKKLMQFYAAIEAYNRLTRFVMILDASLSFLRYYLAAKCLLRRK